MKRIVHLGLGNFHRAHQAWYTAKATDWKITGVVMSNAELKQKLEANEYKYLLGTWGTNGLESEVIDVYDEVLLASNQSKAIIEKIADPQTHVVTLTVTEKGYHLRSEDNHLDLTAPAIANDLKTNEPTSAIGLLAEGLISRFNNGGSPLTVISCDNLSENGTRLKQVVKDYLEARGSDILTWVENNVSFPNSMVDRITPKLSQGATSEIQNYADNHQLSTVGTEAFSEWIIKDDFRGPRPQWDRAGAIFVQDVKSFEKRKLRLLNASHSYLAYAGLLTGHTYVHEAISDERLKAGVIALWDEAALTVSEPALNTLEVYRQQLLDRFSVEEMRHMLEQIAVDGSIKLRERLVPILKARAAKNLSSPAAQSAVESWAKFIMEKLANGEELNDPNKDEIKTLVKNSSDPETALMIWVSS